LWPEAIPWLATTVKPGREVRTVNRANKDHPEKLVSRGRKGRRVIRVSKDRLVWLVRTARTARTALTARWTASWIAGSFARQVFGIHAKSCAQMALKIMKIKAIDCDIEEAPISMEEKISKDNRDVFYSKVMRNNGYYSLVCEFDITEAKDITATLRQIAESHNLNYLEVTKSETCVKDGTCVVTVNASFRKKVDGEGDMEETPQYHWWDRL
jgi:hypothetical protein